MLSERHPVPATMTAVGDIVRSEGPWLSLLLPTARSGPETQAARTALRNLLSLVDEGGATAAVQQVSPLVDSAGFWQHQDLGLSIHANGDQVHLLTTPYALSPEVAWGNPRTAPLVAAAALASDVESYAVVLVGRDRVQLFGGDAGGLTELDHGPVPAREEDLFSDRDHQQSLQQAPQGGGEMSFHSHGADRPAQRVQVERFIRAVVDGLGQHPEIAEADTVVLAGPDETATFLRSIWSEPRLLDATVPGVVDRTPAHELHAAAVELMQGRGRSRRSAQAEAFAGKQGTGLALTDPAEVLDAAAQGRVEALFVGEPPRSVEERDASGEPVDQAITATLSHGGSVLPAADGVATPQGCAALLRF